MSNQWSYEKPTKSGMYFVNFGDIVTEANLAVENMIIVNDELIDKADGVLISSYNNSCKFLKIDISALNKLGSKD